MRTLSPSSMSWKTLCNRLPQLSSSKERLADVQTTLRAYVNQHLRIDLEGREHPQATYDRLFRELQHKYSFIPNEERDLIRLLAMKEHAVNRCKARRLKKSRSRESAASRKPSLVSTAAVPPPRLQPTTADKVFAILQDRPGLKAALVKLRAYSRLRFLQQPYLLRVFSRPQLIKSLPYFKIVRA
ncbi:hypothetical protein CVT26_011982 [Gymnopilus dilepis]|uniref:Uncharacterized protein n=1 Tax=Gymnopilus dilepis TaxID=231916 RepID=A0A409YHX9_9AGAR|nr:hypothetical protein CVT26_011982 [Gymnopilus dilepis]